MKLTNNEAKSLRNYISLYFQPQDKLIEKFKVEGKFQTESAAKKALQTIKSEGENRRPVSGATLLALLGAMNQAKVGLDLTVSQFEREVLGNPGFFAKNFGPRGETLPSSESVIVEGLLPGAAKPSAENDPASLHKFDLVERKKFIEFFGSDIFNQNDYVRLAFPKRVLEDSSDVPFKVDPHCKGVPGDVKPEGVSGYCAFESVMAALYVSNFLAAKTGKGFLIRQGLEDTFNSESCTVSFGLAFTAGTHWLQESLFPRLFEIAYGPSPKQNFQGRTDYFRFNDQTETPDGHLKDLEVREGRDIALIVRVVSSTTAQPWFLAVGRTSCGSAVAASYLVNNWEELHGYYVNKGINSFSELSLAVVIEHKEGLAAQPFGSVSNIEKTATLYNWNDNADTPCIAWGHYGTAK